MSGEKAGDSVERALIGQLGPDAARQLALAQVRVAWDESVAAAGLAQQPMSSRVVDVTDGTLRVEASDAILAQELTLRADALLWAVNQRMHGRPGATIDVRRVAVSVGRPRRARTL